MSGGSEQPKPQPSLQELLRGKLYDFTRIPVSDPRFPTNDPQYILGVRLKPGFLGELSTLQGEVTNILKQTAPNIQLGANLPTRVIAASMNSFFNIDLRIGGQISRFSQDTELVKNNYSQGGMMGTQILIGGECKIPTLNRLGLREETLSAYIWDAVVLFPEIDMSTLDLPDLSTDTKSKLARAIKIPDIAKAISTDAIAQLQRASQVDTTGRTPTHHLPTAEEFAALAGRVHALDTQTTIMNGSIGMGKENTHDVPDTRLLGNHQASEGAFSNGFTVAAQVDIGKIRDNMEDGASFMEVSAPDGTKIFLMQAIDGMGGHEDGQIAREFSIASIAETFRNDVSKGTPMKEALARAARAAAKAVVKYNKEHDVNSGAAGAIACVNPLTSEFYTFNVGDSRIYTLTSNEFKQVTVDHSLAEQQIQEGLWDRKDHRHHPSVNIIQSAFGDQNLLDIDVTTAEVNKGMPYMHTGILSKDGRMVLMTDGIWDMVEDNEIKDILATAKTPQEAAQRFIKAAMDAGGRDNIAVVVLFGPEATSTTRRIVDTDVLYDTSSSDMRHILI